MKKHIIAGVHIANREQHAPTVQEILTRFGSGIHTRLGLHDRINPSNGLILLELEDQTETAQLIKELNLVKGVQCQTMQFEH